MAIDSTKIKGQNAEGQNYSPAKVQGLLGELEKKVSVYLRELEESDCAESATDPERLSAAELKEKISQL